MINQKNREISFPVELSPAEDIIEYLLVTEMGKIHETLLTTDISPLHLNIAIKLLGYKESKELFRVLDADYRHTDQFHEEDEATKTAARFDIFLNWDENGENKEYHVNHFIKNTVTKKHARIQPFIYGGSYLLNGRFKAEMTGDIIAVFTDRGSIANFSNEGHEDDTIWYPNSELFPPADTKLTLTIKPHKTLK